MRLLKLLLEIAREIGDQNAYARHLKVHGKTHSGREWRQFADARFKRKYQNAKCC
jgi:hypothetical protein